jgi:hypothetical protein
MAAKIAFDIAGEERGLALIDKARAQMVASLKAKRR